MSASLTIAFAGWMRVFTGRMSLACLGIAIGANIVSAQRDPQMVVPEGLNPQKAAIERPRQASGSDLITVRIKDSTIGFVLQTIARHGKRGIICDMTNPVFRTRVSVQFANIPMMEAFAKTLQGTGHIAEVAADGRTVVISEASESPSSRSIQSTGPVTGRVIDSITQKKIPGVTVTVVGTKISVVTDAEGAFRIEKVPAGSRVLTAKLLGYASKTISVTVSQGVLQSVTISMSQASTTLSEVVTTVTGNQRKIEIGNDITTLDVPEILKQAPITSVTDLLEARVPGLTVMRTSGVPGASSRIRLRGIGGGLLSRVPGAPTNDPIVVVEGIRVYAGQSGVDDQKLGNGKYPTPSPIDQIDPNSIEKIEVLRGPSASAMYGSDAGDGVIVITTKKGRPGATRWDLSGSGGIETMPGVYAAPGFYRFGHSAMGGDQPFANGSYCPSFRTDRYFDCVLDSVVRFQALNEPRLSTIGRGHNTRLSGTASGGTKELTYSVTGSMANTLGLTRMPALYQDLFRELYDSAPSRRMQRPNTMDMKSGQASFSGNLSSRLTATFTTTLTKSLQYQSSANERLATLASFYLDTTNLSPGRPGQYAYQLRTDATTANHALALNLMRWTWLPLTATVGMNRVERSAESLTPRGILMVEESLVDGVIVTSTPTMSKGNFTERRENVTTNTARVNGTLFPQARTSLSMGSEITQRSNNHIAGRSDSLVPGVSRPEELRFADRSGRSTTTGGWFLEPRLNLNSRFFVNPGFRFDGSGASGSRGGYRGGLWSLFPKLTFSWLAVDREGGAPLWGVLSVVRPRFALGVAGVQPAAEWSLRTLEQDMGSRDPTTAIDSIASDFGLRIRSAGNTRLGPEKTQEVEGGVDLQLWETRLTLSATGYYKMRRNAIQQLPLAPSVGLGPIAHEMNQVTEAWNALPSSSYYANIGHVRNTGVNLSLNATVLDLPTIGWNIDVSVSRNTNTLIKLFGDQRGIDLGNGTRLVKGYPLFGRWSRPISGWSNPRNGTRLSYGEYVVADSAVYMGMQTPDFEMPFRTSITLFRGLLSLNGQFNYKAGLTQYNLGSQNILGNIYENPNSTYGQQAYALAAACFHVGSETANIGKPCTDYGFIQTVNMLRFQSMSIGYNVPRVYLKRFPISSLSLSLQGSNLGLWTNYRGKDPDVNGALVGDATRDSGQLPMPRTWNLYIRIGT